MNTPTMRWLVALAILANDNLAFAQSYNPPTGPLYHEWARKQNYFDSLHQTISDEEFYHEGGEWAEFQKWFAHWSIRSPDGDPRHYDQMMKAYMDAKFHEGSSYRSGDDPWIELGPQRRRNNMTGIGPIRNIAISTEDPNYMLCSSSSGGLFYTADAGNNWHNGGTDLGWPHSGSQGGIFYPESTEKWFAICSYDRIAYTGGIYRTTTSGESWVRIADYEDLADQDAYSNDDPFHRIRKMIFDPELNNLGDHTLFLGTSNGLFRSDNPSAIDPTWESIALTLPPSIPDYYPGAVMNDSIWVEDIEYLPETDSETLCATMRFFNAPGTTPAFSVWRFMLSTDNGETWNEIASPPVGQPTIDPAIGVATVETSAAAPHSFYCLATLSSSWVQAYDTETSSWISVASGFNSAFGGGHAFGVSQFVATSVFVSNLTAARWYQNGALVTSFSSGHSDVEDIVGDPSDGNYIWVAHHGGVSRVDISTTSPQWEDMSDGLGVAEVWSMSTSQNKPDYIALGLYHDSHVITRTPYSSSWDPDWAYLVFGGDGTLVLMHPKDANVVYYADQPQDLAGIVADWSRNDHAESQNTRDQGWSHLSRYFSRGALHREHLDHLYTAELINNGATTYYTVDQNGNPVENNFTNYEIELFRSFDRGYTRERISDFTNQAEVCGTAVLIGNEFYENDNENFMWIRTSPADPDHLYLGIDNYNWQRRIFRNTDIDNPNVQSVRSNWEEVPHPRRSLLGSGDGEREPSPVAIAFDSEDANSIFIAYASSRFIDPLGYEGQVANKMVFKMDVSDLGPNAYPQSGPFHCDDHPCVDLTMNLPNTFVDHECLVYEQGSDGGLYISTEVGAYFTDNKRIAAYDPQNPEDADEPDSSGWVRLGDGLPHVKSQGLEINYQVNRIRTGLTGRGVWEHGLHCPATDDFTETGTYPSDEFLEARVDITSEAVVPDGLKVNYRAGSVVHLVPGFHADEGSRFHAFIHPCDLSGNSFRPKSSSGGGAEAESEVDQERGGTLELFPDPATDELTIRSLNQALEDLQIVRLFDALGKLALEQSVSGPVIRLDVRHLHGFYTVVLDHGKDRSVARVLIN